MLRCVLLIIIWLKPDLYSAFACYNLYRLGVILITLLNIFEIVAPVFILAAVGYFWVKFGFEYRVEFVTQFAMAIALPCLVFTALMKTEFQPYYFGNLFMATIAGFGYAIIVFSVTSIVAFTIGVWVVAGGGSLKQLLKEPLVASTIFGLIFMWQGWKTPNFLTNSLELIGQMAIPLMLITLGVAVARLKITDVKKSFLISFCKILFGIAAAILVSFMFDLPKVAISVLILQFSMPIAVTSYLLAEKYGADSNAVAGLVVVSTFITIGVSPILIAFLIT